MVVCGLVASAAAGGLHQGGEVTQLKGDGEKRKGRIGSVNGTVNMPSATGDLKIRRLRCCC
jgi:hypothetical protein